MRKRANGAACGFLTCLSVICGGVVVSDVAAQSDLTLEGAIARGTAEATIFDTRTVKPQIQVSAPWPGPVHAVVHYLPQHVMGQIDLPEGPPSNLSIGGLLAGPRGDPGPLFPGIVQTPWVPPDPTIAVGPEHIVQTVNMSLAFFGKDGTLQFSQKLNDKGDPGFFEDVGAGGFTFDPKCFYDHHASRFVIIALEVYGNIEESWIDIAVSDDSNPHGVWYKYRTNSVIRVGDTTYWIDYPGFGYDQRGVYVTGNLFKLAGPGGGWGGVLYRLFDKAPMLVGDPARYSDIRDAGGASVQVAHMFDAPDTPYFVQTAGNTAIRLLAVRDPLGSPSLVSANVAVPRFSAPGRNSVPNRGGKGIDPVDQRIFNVSYRDGRVLAGHTVSQRGRNLARWYEFALNDWPDGGDPALLQTGEIDAGNGIHTFFPALIQNSCGAVGMVVARSSKDEYASVQITGRRQSDPLGTMGRLTEVVVGASGYDGGRWGDYFDITVDPLDDETFWIVGEYPTAPNRWATWISRFTLCDDPEQFCNDVRTFKAKCKGAGVIKAKLAFRNRNHDGRMITFLIDEDPFNVRIKGKKARLADWFYSGLHTVSVQTPPDCVEPIQVQCPE